MNRSRNYNIPSYCAERITYFFTGTDAAANLTDEQKQRLQNLRQAMVKVTREYRGKLLEMLTDEQRAKLRVPTEVTKQRML
jgi:hypothetical protein